MLTQHHPKRHALRFKYAFSGIWYTLQSEANFRVHTTIALMVILLGLYIDLRSFEWIVLIGTIAAVLILEMVNTAFEIVVDHLWQEENVQAKAIKDISAGFVLIAAIAAAGIGFLVFAPYILKSQ